MHFNPLNGYLPRAMNSKHMTTRRIKLLLVTSAGLAVFGLVVVSFVLPVYVESRLIPGLIHDLGLDPRQVRVRRIGLWGADLGPIEIAAGDAPLVTISAVQIDYSPFSLLRGHIPGVVLAGARLTLAVDEEGAFIPAGLWQQKNRSSESAPAPLDPRTMLPNGLDRFSIRRAEGILNWNGRHFSIPVELDVDAGNLATGLLVLDADIVVLGNPLFITAKLDQSANIARMKVIGNSFLIESLAQIRSLPTGLVLAGKADLQAEGSLDLKSLDMILSADVKVTEARIRSPLGSVTYVTDSSPASGPSAINIEGRYAGGTLFAEARGALQPLELQLAGGRVEVPAPTFTARLALHPPQSGTASDLSARIDLSRISSRFGSAQIGFPRFTIDTAAHSKAGGLWRLKAEIRADDGKARHKQLALRMEQIGLRLPLRWPSEASAKAGSVGIGRIQWAQRHLGDLKGVLRQRDLGFDIDLVHRSKLLTGLNLLISGGMQNGDMHIEARLPAYQLPQDTDLGQFAPPAAGLLISGGVEANARLTIASGSIESTAALKFDGGSLRGADGELDLTGIQAQIALKDAINLRGGPRQQLRVEQLRFGNLSAKALFVDFQLEPGNTLFIEQAGLDWCNGRVNTAAIRVVPGRDNYDVTLSCDRLNLAMLLNQLGATEASGEGSVNGRIPLRWTEGRLIFDKGFLYSTPGQTGAIQITGTEQLLSGLPPGTPQYTQLDIATEALKDYSYQWAKLSLNSDDQDLLLKLQFDGKPNRLLPFAFDNAQGQFMRVAGEGQAEFKGISIDLNFNTPLNDIMHYKDFLKRN